MIRVPPSIRIFFGATDALTVWTVAARPTAFALVWYVFVVGGPSGARTNPRVALCGRVGACVRGESGLTCDRNLPRSTTVEIWEHERLYRLEISTNTPSETDGPAIRTDRACEVPPIGGDIEAREPVRNSAFDLTGFNTGDESIMVFVFVVRGRSGEIRFSILPWASLHH